MADLDEISRAIGQLEGKFETFKATWDSHATDYRTNQQTIAKKLERIEKYIEYNKGKTAMLAAAISLVFTIAIAIIKDWFRGGVK